MKIVIRDKVEEGGKQCFKGPSHAGELLDELNN